MTEQSILAGLSEQYRALIGNPELAHQMYDLMPMPINIFAPDGTAIFVNRASMKMVNCTDANLLVGKYNLKYDPVCLGIFGQEVMDRIFRGEAVPIPDFPAPIQDVAQRGVIDEKPYQAAAMDLFCLPIWDGGVFVCTICFFTVKNAYEGRADVGKAKAYIRENWREKFDIGAVTAAAGRVNERQLYRMFKEATGITPFEYYRKVKLEKIQEKLMDGSLEVGEAFAACGVDSKGTYFRLFKEKTGMTPTEYRKGKL
jgi:AraC-like DNA-binding protein